MTAHVTRLVFALLVLGLIFPQAETASAQAIHPEAVARQVVDPVPEAFAKLTRPVGHRISKVFGASYYEPGGYASCGGCGEYDECGESGSCATCCCRPCCPCGPAGRFWARADYLLWWTSPQYIPAMVTTGTQDSNGIIGQESTEVLFGDRHYNGEANHGFEVNMGYWLDDCRIVGIQGDYFDMGQGETNYSVESEGTTQLLARPFYNVQTSTEDSEIIADDADRRGSADARVAQDFMGAGIGLRRNLRCHIACAPTCQPSCGETGCGEYDCGEDSCGTGACRTAPASCTRVDLIGGYRYYRLQDSVSFREQVTLKADQGLIPAGSVFDIRDTFRAHNEFHGGEIGIVTQTFRGRWSFEALAKVALGNNQQWVDIRGQTAITNGTTGNTATYDSGFLALEDTNVGRYERDEFVVIPQFGLELGYQLTCSTRLYLGYEFLLWTDVARSGNHIDRSVNPTYLPGSGVTPTGEVRPAFAWTDTDFWAQGMNLGIEIRR